MEDTERTGGTRYSKGKAIQTWLPWLGLEPIAGFVKRFEDDLDAVREVTSIDGCVGFAFGDLGKSMRDPLGHSNDELEYPLLASAGYWIAVALQATQEGVDPGEVDGVPVLATKEACRVSEAGAEKYAPMDWNEGQSLSTLLSSAMRHTRDAYAHGADAINEGDGGHLHLGHAFWNVLCALDLIQQGRADEVDDLTPWQGVTADQADVYRRVAFRLSVDPVDVARDPDKHFAMDSDIEIAIHHDELAHIAESIYDGEPYYHATSGAGFPKMEGKSNGEQADGAKCDADARRV